MSRNLKIDQFLPIYHFSEKHEKMLKCAPKHAYEALQNMDLSKSFLISLLFKLRGLKAVSFQEIQKKFTVLYQKHSEEIVLGLVGQPWKPSGGLLQLSPSEFIHFNQTNYVKMVWSFAFEPQGQDTLVTTETRILCLDEKSKKKFGFYWFFIAPFSKLTRSEMLRLLNLTQTSQG